MLQSVTVRDLRSAFFAIFPSPYNLASKGVQASSWPFSKGTINRRGADFQGSTVLNIRRITFTAATIAACSIIAPLQANAANGCGGASWYALTSKTASGERMNAANLTAAHRSLRFGTKVKVTNARNGKAVVVRINDRGPFIKGRVLDLSKAAAKNIGMINSGTAKVCYEVVKAD